MQLSIKRLRWILLAAALLLVAVLAAFVGYGRFRALSIYRRLLAKSGTTISHDSSGVTFTQALKDKTVITIHAGKATQLGNGQYRLHDVAMSVNSVKDNRTDHIYGNEFTYDQNEGVVRAVGEVHMDLQAPQSLTSAGRSTGPGNNLAPLQAGSAPRPESEAVIHVRTSGLVYLRKLGLAATDQRVEFHYAGVECTAMGAEFNTSESTLRLLSNVVADGVMHGKPIHITALRAEVDRTSNIATLAHPVAVSQDQKAVADLTVLRLRNDGSIESSKSTGNVALTGPTQRITAAELDTALSPQTLPQTARLSGGVTLVDTSPQRPLHGSASTVDIAFDAQGSPQRITGTGGPSGVAALSMLDRRVLAKGLQRNLQGATIVATLVPSVAHTGKHERTLLSEVHAIGAAQGHSEALYTPSQPPPIRTAEPPIKTTSIAADDLRVTFVADAENHPQPQQLFATGRTLLQQDAPFGEQQTSSGDRLEGTFARSEVKGREQLTLLSAVQAGHVVVHRVAALKPATRTSPAATQEVATATADRAAYDGASQKLTLSGSAHLTQDNASLTATSVVLDQRTQDADAFGNVQATLESAPPAPPAGSNPAGVVASRAPEFTHVLASSAHFTHETRQAEFHGSDAQPARMWRDASQVQAAVMLLDDVRRTFSAHAATPGVPIHIVLTGSPAAQAKGPASIVRVASVKMDYSDTLRQAVFTSGASAIGQAGDRVQIDGSSGTIHAQRAVAYLLPAASTPAKSTSPTPFNGSLDRVVITGDVQIDQPGRHGTGEQLVYTAATGDSVLTGTPSNPPHIVDAQQGSITGTTLLFGDAGSTIVVSGQKPAPNQTKPGRVHTETHLQSGTAERH